MTVKKYAFGYHVGINITINAMIITTLQPPLLATPLDDFLYTFSDYQIRSIEGTTFQDQPTPHLTRALETLASQLRANLQNMDPLIFNTALQNLMQHLKLPFQATDTIDTTLTTMLKHVKVDPSNNNKNYLFLNLSYACTEFFKTIPQNQPPDFQALTNHLLQTLNQTVHTIQGAPEKQTKSQKRFFKKRHLLLLLLFLSITIAVSISLYTIIKNRQRQAEQEKIKQHEQEMEKIKQELANLCSQKIDEKQKALDAETSQIKELIASLTHELASLQQESSANIDKLAATHETHQQANCAQIDELAQTLVALDQKCGALAKDYEDAKTLIETQQKTYTKAIEAAQNGLNRLLRSFNTTMSDIDHRVDEVTALEAQAKKGGKSWVDTATEEVNLERFSKAIDVATKGMGAAAVAYGFYQQTRGGDRETPDISSLSTRLAKLRGDTSLSWPKIPATPLKF